MMRLIFKKKNGLLWIFAFVLIFYHISPIYGQDTPIILDARTTRVAVDRGIEYLVEEKPLDHYQVSDQTPGKPYHSQWKKLTAKTINFGLLHKPTWLRFDVINKAPKDVSWLMEAGWPLLDRIEVFQYNQAKGRWYPRQMAGNLLPMAARPIEHRNFLFPLHLEPGELTTFYIRVETNNSMIVTIDMLQQKAFWLSNQHHNLLLGAFFGILIVMLLYNFSLYYFTRDKSYFYYSFYVFSTILYVLAHTGIGNQFIWDGSYWIKQRGYGLFASISFFAATIFIRQFLALKEYGGWVYLLNNIFLFYWAFATLSVAFWMNIVVVKTTEPMALLGCIAALATSIYLWIKGNVSAKYFTIAWSFLIFGTFIYSLSIYNVLERTPATQYTQMVGFVLEVVLLSYALAERINRERAEREEAQQVALELSEKISEESAGKLAAQEQVLELQRLANENLERRVTERTVELEQAVKEKEEHLIQLQNTFHEIRTLQGIIPICSYCKNIRNDEGAWDQMEKYISDHSDAEFSHGVCPNCYKKVMDGEVKEL